MKFDFSKPVGDPFIEAGRLALVEFCKKDRFSSESELKPCIEKLFSAYVFNGSKTLNQIFSDNSKFTHNSTAKDLNKRYQNAINYLEDLLKQNIEGYCISCGKNDNLCNTQKMIFPLTSGDKNVNFTSFFSSNILLCKECAISLFFLPINTQKVSWGRAFAVSSNSQINEFLTEENIETFRANLAKNQDILPDSKINIFENFIYYTLILLQDEDLFGDIAFYLISNVDRNTKIEFIQTYQNQIKFIHQVAPKFFKDELPTKQKDEWNYLIFKYSAKERKENNKKIKFEKEVMEEKNYTAVIKYYNPLINRFIKGESILHFLRKEKCSFNLAKIYLKEIRNMREERLEVIKNVANKLLQLNKDDNKEFIKKFVFPLEKTKNQNEFRGLLRIFARKFLAISKEPLFTADEMVLKILPPGENWQEVKDILLIALYEHLTLDEEIENELEKISTIGEEDE